MCLILLSWRTDADLPLVVAANRDEFHSRPTEALHWWREPPDILAGRDLEAGGTWLGVDRSGRFAALTNFRDARRRGQAYRSRGELVSRYLDGDRSPLDYAREVDRQAYAGFNLLLCDGRELAYVNNRGEDARRLEPGIYGLANAALDAPWHKTRLGKAGLGRLIEQGGVSIDSLSALLAVRDTDPDDDIDSGDLPPTAARALTAPFIVTPDYGTRSSSVVLSGKNGRVAVAERRFAADGRQTGSKLVEFQAAGRLHGSNE